MTAAPIKDTPVDRIDILRMSIDQVAHVVDDIRIRREAVDLTLSKMRRIAKGNATLAEAEPKLTKALERAQAHVTKMKVLEGKALNELNKARAQFLSLGIIEGVRVGIQPSNSGEADQ